MTGQKIRYALSGVIHRLYSGSHCPCCGVAGLTIDQKWPYQLKSCNGCGILYRYPGEAAGQMEDFYQDAYSQQGLTTELPDDRQLKTLIQTNFKGTEKNISPLIKLLRKFGVRKGSKILDFGANWGYGVLQLNKAGFSGVGYEISVPRASFAKKLGVNVVNSVGALKSKFDVIFSSHVLEHTPNPIEALRIQSGLLRRGGILMGITPNGDSQRQKKDFSGFHVAWGQVHPFLLTGKFINRVFAGKLHSVGGSFSEFPAKIGGRGDGKLSLGGSELVFAAKI